MRANRLPIVHVCICVAVVYVWPSRTYFTDRESGRLCYARRVPQHAEDADSPRHDRLPAQGGLATRERKGHPSWLLLRLLILQNVEGQRWG